MAHGSGLSNVLTVFKSHGANVRSHGSYYTVQCPAHDDRTASLSLSQGEKGAVLKCHAGCDVDSIRAELGLNWPDLFDNGGKLDEGERRVPADLWMPCQSPKRDPGDPEPCPGHKVAEYRYTDEEGNLLFGVARCSRKGQGCQGFRQWVPDGSKKYGKRWSVPAHVPRVLYDLPRVVEAARSGRRIYLVEGEKDAERMKADFPDEVVTTQSSGAGASKWRVENTRYFKGASEVIIIADCDGPGLTYAEEAHRHISKIVKKVKVVCSPILEDGADFSDHRNYGYGLDEFEVVPFETIARRPPMVIQVEERHREKPVAFPGYSEESVERSLLGSMLKYGMDYGINAVDVQTDDRLRIAAGAIGRLVAEDSVITPETVAVEVENAGEGGYEKALKFLYDLEKVAFDDKEKPAKAARIVRERSMRRGLVYACRAAEEAAQNETRAFEEILNHLGHLTKLTREEYAQLAQEYCAPTGDVFMGDVVEEAAKEAGIGDNVRELYRAAPAQRREAAAQKS